MKKLLVAAATSAGTVALMVLPAGGALAAPRAPLNNVITAKQFPGFTVTDKPVVFEDSNGTDGPCDVPAPADSVTVTTTLSREAKVSSGATRTTLVTETLTRVRTWQQAHIYFAKFRAVLTVPSCSTIKEDGETTTVTVLPTAHVAGSDEGFAVKVAIKGDSDSKTLTTTSYVHRAGRDFILITPAQIVSTRGDQGTTTFEDTTAVRALGEKAVKAALTRLTYAR